jgi:ABC-type transporter Mla subunit MlaD
LLAIMAAVALFIFNARAVSDLARPRIEVMAVLPNAPDVRVGTDVWVEGVRAGRVTEVGIIKEGDSTMVALRLRLRRPARALVTRSSDVRASRRRFIAEPVVRVFAGEPGDPPLQPGDTIRGHPRPGPAALLARVQALGPTMDSVLAAAIVVQEAYARREPDLERLAGQLEAATAAMAGLAAQAEAGSLGRMLDADTGIPAHVRTLGHHVAGIRAAVDELTDRYAAAGRLRTEARALERRVEAVDAAVALLDARVREGQGFIGRIQADTALRVAVRGVQLQIDSLLAEAHSIALRMFLP